MATADGHIISNPEVSWRPHVQCSRELCNRSVDGQGRLHNVDNVDASALLWLSHRQRAEVVLLSPE
ncbi:hypothetical protein JYU34_019967 [Plutella xylostella]|uniref:Uncharacterized protein n=1 Tax=Plutella xylostella TaxID=51655 RepID=A0ABQ7PVN6_PLUXY|nr:hypothetical protein JYU34_019967 [Plutella xylostella]